MKNTTDFKKDYGFGGTGGGRLRNPCRDCRHYFPRTGLCRHPDTCGFHVPRELAVYKGCRRGWAAKEASNG